MNKIIGLIGLGLMMFLTTSCNNDSETINEPLSSTLQKGSWKISTFDYTDSDISGWYKDYKFIFTEQNSVTAVGRNFYLGKWTIKTEGEILILVLDFPKTNPIQYLNYDWMLLSYDDKTISLAWDNPYFGGTDYLIFTKI